MGIALVLAAPSVACAQLRANAPEFRLTTEKFDHSEWLPAVAAYGDGRFVAAWVGKLPGEFNPSVIVRVVNPDETLDVERRGSTRRLKRPESCRVAASEAGATAVLWIEGQPDVDESGQQVVWLNIFDPTFHPVRHGVRVSRTQAQLVMSPSVAMLADGTTMVVWSYVPIGDERSTPRSLARIYDVAGRARSGEIPLSGDGTTNDAFVVASRRGDEFLVCWRDQNARGEPFRIARYDGNGRLRRQPAAFGEGSGAIPVLAPAEDGGFVAAWMGDDDPGEPDVFFPSAGIFAQAFDANDVPRGPVYHVNQFVPGLQWLQSLVPDGAGGYFSAWQSTLLSEYFSQDGSEAGIFGRHLTSDGRPDGLEVQINTLTAGDQGVTGMPVALASYKNRILVAWTDAAIDPDGSGIAARWLVVHRRSGTLCGDAYAQDLQVNVNDALKTLRAAFNGGRCTACLCDADGSGTVTATDAMRVLRVAVGLKAELSCPVCPDGIDSPAGEFVLP